MHKRTEELIKSDAEYIIHPWYMVGQNSGIVFEKSRGIYLVDTEGMEYIDMASGNCCCNLGHGRREIIDAVTKAINETDFTTAFFGHSNVYAIECSKRLARLTPGTLKHFHFTSGGSEAVDTALKTARLYWSNQGQAGKYKIISLYDSYHGASGFSAYVTGSGQGAFQNAFGPAPVGLIRIPSFYCYRCTYGLSYPACDVRCARILEDVIQAEGSNSVAAFIAEPMIGGGGFFGPPMEWWQIIRDICQQYQVLLIADEILSGFARTGKMFGLENWAIEPDMMAMSKGINGAYLPFGAMAISDKVYQSLKGTIFSQGFTYCGHAVSAAAACAALDIYVKDRVVENVVKVGNHVKQRLEAEFSQLPCVGNIGGMGLNYALELVENKNTKKPIDPATKKELVQNMLENGIYTRIIGRLGNRLHIGPPCTITVDEADKALDIIQPLVAGLKF